MRAHTQNKPSKQKLLSAFITSVFCSTSVYAVDHTDTIQVPTRDSVTLNAGDTVTVENKNGIEILETGLPAVGTPSGTLTADGAVISVTGTDSNTAGIHINASGTAVVNLVNTKVTNESGWGIVIENLNNGSSTPINFSGADTLIEGGAGAIKFAPNSGSSIVEFSNEAHLNGDVQIADDPASPMNYTQTIRLKDKAQWTGDINSDARAIVELAGKSNWNGDVNISSSNPDKKGTFVVQLNDSAKSGHTQFDILSSVSSSIHLQNTSTWTGDVEINDSGANSSYSFTVENGTWEGDLSAHLKSPSASSPTPTTATMIGLLLTDDAQWKGNISLTSDEDANHGHLNMVIMNEKGFNNNIAVSGKNTFSSLTMNSSWNGDGSFNLISDASKQNEFTFSLINGSRTGKTDISAENGKAMIMLGGASTWDGDINISGANQTAGDKVIYLAGKSTLAGTVNADTTAMMLIDSKWNLSGNSVLESIDMQTDAEINFAANTKTKAGGFHTLTVDDLNSDGSGSIHMRTDIAALTGDRLNITNSVTGDVNIHVNNQGGAYVNPYKELTIIDSNGYQDHFQLAAPVEVGGYEYNMRADGDKLNLYTTGRPTSSAEASVNAMGAGYLMRYAETQTLQQRMGDLRQYEGLSNDVWARAYSGEFNVGNSALMSMSGYDLDYSGVQIGADRQFTFSSGKGYLGVMAGFTEGKQKHNQGNGTIDSTNVGVYGTYIHNNGVYADAQLRYVHMNHDYDVRDSAGTRVDGSAKTDGYAASLAVGKRFYLEPQKDEGWYVQPEVQISTSYQNSLSFKTATNGLNVDVDGYQSTLAQAGARLGHEINSANKPFNVYVKAAYVQELDSKVDFQLNGLREKEQFGNNWWTFGAGVSTTLNKQHNVYFDVERSDGATFKNPWQVNLGYRYGF